MQIPSIPTTSEHEQRSHAGDAERWSTLADAILAGDTVTRHEATAILESDLTELLSLLQAAFRLRAAAFGTAVNLHVLKNAKSGVCPEDCGFCSQSTHFNSDIPRYAMQSREEIVGGARAAAEAGAVTYCIVTSTRRPSEREIETVCAAAREIKSNHNLRLCASLGFLSEKHAQRLAEAGIDRYNHNLETARAHFAKVVSSHGFEDRMETVLRAQGAGMEICCGGIVGMGESFADRVDLAFTLRELNAHSIPVNFLDPRPGTPLADVTPTTPSECLRTLAMFRFVNPCADIRVAGGREANLRSLQPLALYAASSMFTQGYLTTGGQGLDEDQAMIRDAGFELGRLEPA